MVQLSSKEFLPIALGGLRYSARISPRCVDVRWRGAAEIRFINLRARMVVGESDQKHRCYIIENRVLKFARSWLLQERSPEVCSLVGGRD